MPSKRRLAVVFILVVCMSTVGLLWRLPLPLRGQLTRPGYLSAGLVSAGRALAVGADRVMILASSTSTVSSSASFTSSSTTPSPSPTTLKMGAKQTVDQHIADSRVVVFSKSCQSSPPHPRSSSTARTHPRHCITADCPYCKRTKALLSELGANATVFELDQLDEGASIPLALAGVSDADSCRTWSVRRRLRVAGLPRSEDGPVDRAEHLDRRRLHRGRSSRAPHRVAPAPRAGADDLAGSQGNSDLQTKHSSGELKKLLAGGKL